MENDMQLTEHFKLSEFVHSSTAQRLGIDNTLDVANPAHAVIIANLRNLCEQVLEPLRVAVKEPVVICSGYRCPQLNTVVGGVSNSQHLTGEAADLRIPIRKTDPKGSTGAVYVQDMAVARAWIKYLLEYGRFDQLILEHDSSGFCWLHVSLKRDDSQNRQTYIPNLLKKR